MAILSDIGEALGIDSGSWSSITDAAGNVIQEATSIGQIGTYYWVKDFQQFLYSYADIIGIKENWCLNPGYAFKVVSSDTCDLFAPFGEFRLPINPSSLQQNEEFAISFKPTQNGMVIEHSGAIFKEIIISGTTGIAPTTGVASADSLIAQQGGLSSTLNSIPTSVGGLIGGTISGFNVSNTGFTWAHLLRNYIRSYAQTKTLPSGVGLALVFVNRKDNEEWMCEPTGFDITRSAGRGFLYDYRITLRAYKRNVPTNSGPIWWQDIINGISNVENIANNAVALLGGGYNILTNAISELKQIESSVVSTILSPTANLLDTLNGIKNTAAQFPATQRKVLTEYKSEVTRVKQGWEDLTGQGDADYNAIYGRTPVANPPAGRTPSVREVEITEALNDLVRGTNCILATDAMFASDPVNPKITSVTQSSSTSNSTLNSPKNLAKRVSSKTQIEAAFGNTVQLVSPASTIQALVNRGDTLEDIALRTTGNVDNWIEIAIINDLVYPYIDDAVALTNSRVLKTGDAILVPSSAPQVSLSFPVRESNLTSGLSLQEKFLGIDLRLNSDFGLILSSNQDFELCYGMTCAMQGVNTLLALEKGSLKHHPEIGLSLNIGGRTPMTAQNLAVGIKDGILSDSRFEDVTNLTVSRSGASYLLNLHIKIANYANPVPMTIPI